MGEIQNINNKQNQNEMKQTHLITLSARIDELEQLRILNGLSFEEFTRLALDANKQSKTIVTLAHFVPCDANGVPLEEPKEPTYSAYPEVAADEYAIYSDLLVDYYDDLREAQKSVIFEGWERVGGIVENEKGDMLYVTGDRVFLELKEGIEQYSTSGLHKIPNPTLADLAAATTENPLKLK